jgi:hypothetical protein
METDALSLQLHKRLDISPGIATPPSKGKGKKAVWLALNGCKVAGTPASSVKGGFIPITSSPATPSSTNSGAQLRSPFQAATETDTHLQLSATKAEMQATIEKLQAF